MGEQPRFQSVQEWFDWKTNNEKESVEAFHKDALKKLKWRHPDVLYSFLGIYCLGLETQCTDSFNKLRDQSNNQHQKPYSLQLLQQCSADERFRDFNSAPELNKLLNHYFSLGNLIPVWPGGNIARGMSGVYDIPEVFFHRKDVCPWAEHLLTVYPEAALSDVVKANILATENGSVYAAFDNIQNFKTWLGHSKNYYRYLSHCVQIIQRREEYLERLI